MSLLTVVITLMVVGVLRWLVNTCIPMHVTNKNSLDVVVRLIPCLSLVALLAGCDKEPTTSQQIDRIKTETKEAARSMQNYTFAQKEQFLKQMQTQMDALNQDLDRLSAKVENSSDAV